MVRGAWCVVTAAAGLDHVARFDLSYSHLERDPLHAQPQRALEQLLRALRAIQRHRVGARLQPQRPDQPDHAEKMIGVKVREEDLGQRKAHPVAHHLALGAFATLEEEGLPFANHGDSGHVSLYGGAGGRRTKESDGEHGGEYKGVGSGEWSLAVLNYPPV